MRPVWICASRFNLLKTYCDTEIGTSMAHFQLEWHSDLHVIQAPSWMILSFSIKEIMKCYGDKFISCRPAAGH